MKRENYLLKNVNIVDVVNKQLVMNSSLYVEDGKIKSINGDDVRDASVIDCNGKYLVPGLINLHVHLFSTGKPSNTVNQKGNSQAKLIKFINTKLGDKVLNLIVKSNLKTIIKSGTTTIRTVGDINYSDIKQRDLINQYKYLGPRMISSGPSITCVGGHGAGTISKTATTKKEYEDLVQNNFDNKVDFIKIMITGGVMDAKEKGDSVKLRMSLEEVKWVCDKAHKLGLKVAAHVESSEGVKVALKGGVDSVEHAAILDKEAIDLFKKNKSSITATISPALPFGEMPIEVTHCTDIQKENGKVVAEGIISAAKTAIKENITLGLGTDAACPFAFQYGTWRELAYFNKYVGMNNADCLWTATINNAKILGLDKEIGSIDVNKSADFMLTLDNPFENLRTLEKPIFVMKEGYLIKNPKIKRETKYESQIEGLLK